MRLLARPDSSLLRACIFPLTALRSSITHRFFSWGRAKNFFLDSELLLSLEKKKKMSN
jgi:hypothetical protein